MKPSGWDRVFRWMLVGGVFLISAGLLFWFSLVYTIHQGTVSVPDLVGKTVEEAEAMGHDRGLEVTLEDGGVFNDSVAIGLIGAQRPPAGFHLKSGSEVRLRISLGHEKTSVPNLEGLSLPAAAQKLAEAGLHAGRRVEVSGQSASADIVLASSPEFGRILRPNEEVAILINHTPARKLWIMPRLLDMPLSRVRRFAKKKHLRIGRLHEVEYPGYPPGIILRQYPPAGLPLAPSDIISLWISR